MSGAGRIENVVGGIPNLVAGGEMVVEACRDCRLSGGRGIADEVWGGRKKHGGIAD